MNSVKTPLQNREKKLAKQRSHRNKTDNYLFKVQINSTFWQTHIGCSEFWPIWHMTKWFQSEQLEQQWISRAVRIFDDSSFELMFNVFHAGVL